MGKDDYYKILGVDRDASDEAIKRAYRKLARKYHPDVHKGADAAERFQAVGEAYDVLRDPEKRAAYDQYGEDWQNPQPQYQDTGWQGGFGFAPDDLAREDNQRFSEFFDAFRNAEFRQPTEQHVRLALDLEDVFAGARRNVTIRLPQMDAGGRIVWEDKTLAVRIPKGVVEGQHIRLRGQGAQGADLIAEIILRPHPVFRVDGRDIHLQLPVTPWEAALGAKVAMPTPGGKVQITVPSNARSGQRLRLKGRGLPGAVSGDMFAEIQIVNPPVKTVQAREFYENMARELAFDPRQNMGG